MMLQAGAEMMLSQNPGHEFWNAGFPSQISPIALLRVFVFFE
jgi:hypothetical protein